MKKQYSIPVFLIAGIFIVSLGLWQKRGDDNGMNEVLPTNEQVAKVIKDTYYPQEEDVFISTAKVEGGFAIGSASFGGGGGHEWYAKQEGEGWKIFLKTQEQPACTVLRKNAVPPSFYFGPCWDDSGKNLVPYEEKEWAVFNSEETDMKLPISFRYPSSWFHQGSVDGGAVSAVSFFAEGEYSKTCTATEGGGEQCSVSGQIAYLEARKNEENDGVLTEEVGEKVVIDGYEGVVRKGDFQVGIEGMEYISGNEKMQLVLPDVNGYRIQFLMVIRTSEDERKFNEILGTLQFGNANSKKEAGDVSEWPVYRNEEYGFEVRYPKEWKIEACAQGSDVRDLMLIIAESEKENCDAIPAGRIAVYGLSTEDMERHFSDQPFQKITVNGQAISQYTRKFELTGGDGESLPPAPQMKVVETPIPFDGNYLVFSYNELFALKEGAADYGFEIDADYSDIYQKILQAFKSF